MMICNFLIVFTCFIVILQENVIFVCKMLSKSLISRSLHENIQNLLIMVYEKFGFQNNNVENYIYMIYY